VHIGFNHLATADPTFGNVAYYTTATGASAPAAVIDVASGSSLVFENDASQPNHTASGLGTTGFPAAFDNTGGTTPTGTAVDGGTTWSTGTLAGGATSAAFTIGPPGNYYFGCFYHYVDAGMRDVIVSH
jgi:plastocyanin